MKKIISIINKLVFVVVTLFTIYVLQNILFPKRNDGYTNLKNFYDCKKDSLDVIFLGSSHIGMNLCQDYFQDSLHFQVFFPWGSLQPAWNSYYTLKECLKTQKPKVVIFETFATAINFQQDLERQCINTAGMKWSLNKIINIFTTGYSSKDIYTDLTLFPICNTRYKGLSKNDFQYFFWNKHPVTLQKANQSDVTFEETDEQRQAFFNCKEISTLNKKNEKYLRKIIALCKKKNILLILINTPTSNRLDLKPSFNAIELIAKETNTPYINYDSLDDETGLNRQTDWLENQGGHLDYDGALKISKHLGKKIISAIKSWLP